MHSKVAPQKVCDICDFFDPEVDQIIREELRTVPFGSRRAWEFAMIFRGLREKGMLTGHSRGLAMGAGTERLIYSIAPHVERLAVTDLYGMAEGWKGVQTENPKNLIIERAPWKFDASRLEAYAMDMRALDFKSSSFDFCWSTGAFEHIGDEEDFAKHLREVDRVLRPGGVYVFTTAIVFGKESLRIPHNYYFSPHHLVDLLHQSPLHADDVFDCRVREHLFNRPHPERLEDYGCEALSLVTKPIVSFRRGAMLTANVMVLTKEPSRQKTRAKVVGFEESCTLLAKQRDTFLNRLWANGQILQPQETGNGLFVQPQMFGAGPVELDIVCVSYEWKRHKAVLKSRALHQFHEWREEGVFAIASGGRTRFQFLSSPDRIYSVTLITTGSANQHDFVIRARRISTITQEPVGRGGDFWAKIKHVIRRISSLVSS